MREKMGGLLTCIEEGVAVSSNNHVDSAYPACHIPVHIEARVAQSHDFVHSHCLQLFHLLPQRHHLILEAQVITCWNS